MDTRLSAEPASPFRCIREGLFSAFAISAVLSSATYSRTNSSKFNSSR
ncbi:MAG: photosystem II assembly family protein [Bacteroidia bacterium]